MWKNLTICVLIFSCAFSATAERFQYIPLKKDKTYPLRLTQNDINPKLTDILVDLPEHNELKELGTYEDVYTEHPYPAEYRNDTLYLLKKKQTYNGILTELWQYRGENSTLIYAAYDYLTFRVSPDDKYLAIFADKKIIFLTTNGEKKRTLNWQDLYPKNTPPKAVYNIQPAQWNDAGTEFWFVLKNSQNRVERVFCMNTQNWKYIPYENLPLKPVEYAVSSLGNIAYSDWSLTKQNIFTLYLYNLRTKKIEVIATSNYKYEPEWRNDKLDFNSPANGQTRVTKGLD